MFEGFNFIIDYGLSGVLVTAMVFFLILHYKLEKRFDVHDNADSQKEIKENCVMRKGEFKKIFDKIEDIEKTDGVDAEKFKGIDVRFDHLETSMNGIAQDVKEILMHLAKKGMG